MFKFEWETSVPGALLQVLCTQPGQYRSGLFLDVYNVLCSNAALVLQVIVQVTN